MTPTYRLVSAEKLAKLLRYDVVRLTDPNPVARERHVAVWEAMRLLPAEPTSEARALEDHQ